DHLRHLKEWDKAAEVYLDILKNYSDRVMPPEGGAPDRAYQYTGMVPAVHRQLSLWPQEGLDAFRARYETDAAAQLDAASDDPAKLNHILNYYLPTDAAKKAGIRLMDIYLEQGDFDGSARVGEQLLKLHQ